MKKDKLILTFSLLGMMLLSFYSTKAQNNYSYLTSGVWKLSVIEVDTFSYSDPTLTDLEFTFNNGTFILAMYSGGVTSTVPFEFETFLSDNPSVYLSQDRIVLNRGAAEEQIFNIEFVNENYFIYNSNFLVNGTTYNYRFKMLKI